MRLLNQKQCRDKFGASVTKWYEVTKLPGFPRPVNLKTAVTVGGQPQDRKRARPRYLESEIDAFIQSLADKRGAN